MCQLPGKEIRISPTVSVKEFYRRLRPTGIMVYHNDGKPVSPYSIADKEEIRESIRAFYQRLDETGICRVPPRSARSNADAKFYKCPKCERFYDGNSCNECVGGSGSSFDEGAERDKIKNGTYPSHIQKGKQRKHSPGTREFQQEREKLNRRSPGSEPSILNNDVDAQELVNRYKGTGKIRKRRGSDYPEEIVKTNKNIGKTWVISKQKYIDTDTFTIVYSKDGTHIYPRSSI